MAELKFWCARCNHPAEETYVGSNLWGIRCTKPDGCETDIQGMDAREVLLVLRNRAETEIGPNGGVYGFGWFPFDIRR